MPLYDQNSFIFVFLENSQKPPNGFKCAVKRRMSDNPILGFFYELPGGKVDSARRHEHYEKTLFFVLFAQQEPSDATFILCAVFVKLNFSIR